MIPMLVLYLLIYVLLFVYARNLCGSDAGAPGAMGGAGGRSRCPGKASTGLVARYASFVQGQRYASSEVEFAAIAMMIVAAMCLAAQLVCMFASLFVIKTALAFFATACTLFSRKFETERIGAVDDSLLGYFRELFLWISTEGTRRGDFIDRLRDRSRSNMCTAFNFMRILRFNLFNFAYSGLLLVCLSISGFGPWARKYDAAAVQYSALVFGLVNMFGSFADYDPYAAD